LVARVQNSTSDEPVDAETPHRYPITQILQAVKTMAVDLQLSGHTHGGQVMIPGVGPVVAFYKSLAAASPNRCGAGCHSCEKTVPSGATLGMGAVHQVGTNQLY